MSKPQITTLTTKSFSNTVYDIKWVPSTNKLAVLGSFAKGTGTIQVVEFTKGELKSVSETEKHTAFKCGTFGASSAEERYLATGGFDGRVSLWDLERTELAKWTAKGHDGIINAIDGIGGFKGSGAPEIVTSSRDGNVCVWDPRVNEPVVILQPASGKPDCWAVTFGDAQKDNRVVAAGYDNGDLKLFDLRTLKTSWETNLKHGICSIEFDRKDIEMNKLVATTLGATFHVFDMRTFHPKSGYASVVQQAHDSTVWSVRHLPQNRDVFLTSGGNGATNLWKYVYPSQRQKKDTEGLETGVAGKVELLATQDVSSMPILSIDWCEEKEGLCAIGALDQSVKVLAVTQTPTI